MTLRIGWFTSARGAGSRGMFEAVHNAIEEGSLDAEFAAVFVNREPGEDAVTDRFFDLVRVAGIPLAMLSSVRYRREVGGERSRPGEPLPAWRATYDAEVARLLAPHRFDVGVLAGYMLIFSAAFVEQHSLLNLHPAFPGGPIGTWREVIRALIRERASEAGVMVHLAVPEVDAGPVAAYCRYSIRGEGFDPLWAEIEGRIDDLDDVALEETALFRQIRATGVTYEAPFLVAALQAFATGRLTADRGRLLDEHGAEASPADVTRDVEAGMRPAPARS